MSIYDELRVIADEQSALINKLATIGDDLRNIISDIKNADIAKDAIVKHLEELEGKLY